MNDRLIFYWSKKGLNLSLLQFNSWTFNFFTMIHIWSPRKMHLDNWFIPNSFIYSAVSSNWPYIDYPEFRKALAFCKVKDEIIILNGTLSLFDAEQKCKQRFARLCMWHTVCQYIGFYESRSKTISDTPSMTELQSFRDVLLARSIENSNDLLGIWTDLIRINNSFFKKNFNLTKHQLQKSSIYFLCSI